MPNAIVDNFTPQELQNIVNNSINIKDLMNKLGYSSASGNCYKTVELRLIKYNINYDHLKQYVKLRAADEDIFTINSTVSQATLRRHFLHKNLVPYKCSICGMEPIWQGKDLTLILDHINGKNNDNQLINLRWVCPNCNQQLETTGYKKYRSDLKSSLKKINYCKICNSEITNGAELCFKCNNIAKRTVNRPSREELKQLIRTTPFTQIGKQFNVSDNAVRKWCKAENLPSKVTEIKQYTDKEWQDI